MVFNELRHCNLSYSVGTHRNAATESTCVPCEPGYYQSTSGSTDCNPCPAGYYCRVGVVVRVTCLVMRIMCGSEGDMCGSEGDVW